MSQEILHKIRARLNDRLRGRSEVVELALACLLARGHLLIEDVPGVGKTTLANALSDLFGLEFSRIQLTSDLLPSDLTGVNVFNPDTRQFEFRPGPVFSNVLLADELNRTPPKTQGALLEAMEEKRVSVDGTSHSLQEPFFVIATQNPMEQAGTFPLPESQLDRFLMRLRIGYPPAEVEIALLHDRTYGKVAQRDDPLASRGDLMRLQQEVDAIQIHDDVANYLWRIVHNSRNHESVRLGISPRGGIALGQAARAFAYLAGRDWVGPDDIAHMAGPVLGHRLALQGISGRIDGLRQDTLVREILDEVAVPV